MNINWIRELFSFSRKERGGITTLLIIIFVLVMINILMPRFISHRPVNYSEWEAEVNTYLANTEQPIPRESSLRPVVFNPNEADSVTLITMGIPPKVVVNWIRYLEKGGRFRNKDGVKKIYGMTTVLFEQLDHFMVIPQLGSIELKGENSHPEVRSTISRKRDTIWPSFISVKKEKIIVKREVNSADSVQLVEIPGIGPVLAARIIRYRNLLGGYYDISQLREVYGMREDNFTAVSPYFTIDPSSLKTFNINFSTIQELGRHPYVGFKTARKVIGLRDRSGKFSAPEDLSTVVSADSLVRVLPYLKFSQ